MSSAGQVTRGDLPWASRGRGGDLATFLAIGEGTSEGWTGDLLWIRLVPPVAIESAPAFDVPTFTEERVNKVHKVLIVEDPEILSWLELEIWMLQGILHSSAWILLLPLAST